MLIKKISHMHRDILFLTRQPSNKDIFFTILFSQLSRTLSGFYPTHFYVNIVLLISLYNKTLGCALIVISGGFN